MYAVLCHSFGPISDLRLEEMAEPVPGPGQVVLRVEAAGVNFYDGLAAQGKYQTKPDLPFAPGGEVAGTITACGAGVTHLRPGQRVLGFIGFGGYAQSVAVAAEHVHPIPDSMDFATAAGFLIAYATAHHALKDRARLAPGETLLVLGAAGGVGLAAVEIGRRMGARVIAAASSDDKLALAQDHGAEVLVNYATGDLRAAVKAATGGRGVDVVLDPVGGERATAALRSMATAGRYLVIGFASGTIPEIAFNQLLLKQISVTGVLWGAFARADPAANAANLAELLAWHGEGALRPHISARLPLARFAEGLGAVMEGRAQGKVVLLPWADETEDRQ